MRTGDELDAAIAKEARRSQRLRAALNCSQERLKTLIEARKIARGEMAEPKRQSIPDRIEELMRARGGPLHVDEIRAALRDQYGLIVAKETVTTSLWRYAKAKKRFRNVGPNKFTLR